MKLIHVVMVRLAINSLVSRRVNIKWWFRVVMCVCVLVRGWVRVFDMECDLVCITCRVPKQGVWTLF